MSLPIGSKLGLAAQAVAARPALQNFLNESSKTSFRGERS